MRTLHVASLLVVLSVVVTFPATAATIHVPDEQPTIQAGIDAATAGDTVLVACGTYYEHDIVMKSGVCLRSETGTAECVVIDAQLQGRVISCSYVDGSSRIEGLTLTGGLPTGPARDSFGGGIHCVNSSPTIAACNVTGNSAVDGGGICCEHPSPATLIDCVFSNNSASGCGGGMRFQSTSASSPPTLINCTFVGNTAAYDGGGICLSSQSSGYPAPVLTDCVFYDNSAAYGGGMSLISSSAELTGCSFIGNSEGVWVDSCFPLFASCTFADNDGFAMLLFMYARAVITNTIVASNGAAIDCGFELTEAELTCCDVYGNDAGDWVDCIADQYGVNGNFSEDPLFCGDLSPDEPYTLHVDSPCALGNNPECGLIGAWGVACGLTAVEPVSWGAIKAMFQ